MHVSVFVIDRFINYRFNGDETSGAHHQQHLPENENIFARAPEHSLTQAAFSVRLRPPLAIKIHSEISLKGKFGHRLLCARKSKKVFPLFDAHIHNFARAPCACGCVCECVECCGTNGKQRRKEGRKEERAMPIEKYSQIRTQGKMLKQEPRRFMVKSIFAAYIFR